MKPGPRLLKNFGSRKLLFVGGKGGVGKTSVSQAWALQLSRAGHKTLWITIEDPLWTGEVSREISPLLTHLNLVPGNAFEEYIALKTKIPGLASLFVRNRLIQGLAKAAPGVHELVLLGKVYYELRNYDRVVVDLPATGHGLAMFHATRNFAQLFRTGKAREDADKMLAVFQDPAQCGFVLVSLPEEMPLQETLELDQALRQLFPDNPGMFVCNRLFPKTEGWEDEGDPDSWTSPLARDAGDYCRKRARLEHVNLELWRSGGHVYAELPFLPPPTEGPHRALVEDLSLRFSEWAKEARA